MGLAVIRATCFEKVKWMAKSDVGLVRVMGDFGGTDRERRLSSLRSPDFGSDTKLMQSRIRD